MRAAMTEGDAVITAYRCHGWTLLQGATVAEVLSELTGGFVFYRSPFAGTVLKGLMGA